ncbi:hypothetical protein ASG36_07990 [Geodermatophilus sp. Leaf369]|uniref:HNH endonuclease signature motif containing protein n=1 Tax=Geodermatophilus sp. Leaf369 TaxID=1736354 RepID=UPI0006F34499|nr:HNH endonuclease signature motif containing protein [Geodermatophilus sp. Leaf369]KQS60796.1 hypothetical protein ASG36_07990 [Geodermatophilus sp. Leaf369]
METGLRWEVGVSASLAAPDPWPDEELPAGVTRRRTRLSEIVDVSHWDDAACASALQALADADSQLAAFRADVVKRFADVRPDLWDLNPDDPAARVEGWGSGRTFNGVTEFFTDELATVLGTSRMRADTLANFSLVLREQLVDTWHALADGRIDQARAQALVTALGWQAPAVDPDVVAAVEHEALDWAISGEGPYRLRERAAALLLQYDAEASDRRRKAAKKLTDVTVRNPADGFADFVVRMPTEVAAASWDTCDTYARMRKAAGDTRPIGELRALVASDLILRPWDTSLEPVTAHLTLLAPLPSLVENPSADPPGPDAPPECGRIGNQPITAAHLRELLTQLGFCTATGLQVPPGSTVDVALTKPGTETLRAVVTPHQLRHLARRGCLEHQGTGLSCDCPVLDAPPPTDAYRPTAEQNRFIDARDRTCRHPGCSRPARFTDADHVVAFHDGGPTSCDNLCNLCRRHHRLKTHAPGWHYSMTPDGRLSVTTPSGVTRTSAPPGTHHRLRPDDLLHPLETAVPELPPPADDPPPF